MPRSAGGLEFRSRIEPPRRNRVPLTSFVAECDERNDACGDEAADTTAADCPRAACTRGRGAGARRRRGVGRWRRSRVWGEGSGVLFDPVRTGVLLPVFFSPPIRSRRRYSASASGPSTSARRRPWRSRSPRRCSATTNSVCSATSGRHAAACYCPNAADGPCDRLPPGRIYARARLPSFPRIPKLDVPVTSIAGCRQHWWRNSQGRGFASRRTASPAR